MAFVTAFVTAFVMAFVMAFVTAFADRNIIVALFHCLHDLHFLYTPNLSSLFSSVIHPFFLLNHLFSSSR